MKKNKLYFIFVFIVLIISAAYNLMPRVAKSVESKRILASIDRETVDRKDIVNAIGKVSHKNFSIKVDDEEDCDVIVKYKSSITKEQLKNYKVVEVKDDYIVPIAKKEKNIFNIDLNSKSDNYLIASNDVANFVESKVQGAVKVYKQPKDTYKLVKKEDVFNGFVHLVDLSKGQLESVNILNFNGISYTDPKYPLKDKLCVLIKNDGVVSNIDIESIKSSIKLDTEEKR
ncbi:hypothetical protein [Inconstantimicrobium mannanitabidum]|uniref:Uncharacterized protein n=1 Tax=Inconstantimicrobium mannanitabidum TaxID=1604901 RepID=A0ACB5RG51_9CLOT|nr:hypothetical protein [Clostridium sp. TW13]GKX68069.1 hypothetical protein rsdtw13_33270 [Clostridium sp. TW13]